MDFLMTMDDGSTATLSHHGVKGMKWGVRKKNFAAYKKWVSTTEKGRANKRHAKKQTKQGIRNAKGFKAKSAAENKGKAREAVVKKKAFDNNLKAYKSWTDTTAAGRQKIRDNESTATKVAKVAIPIAAVQRGRNVVGYLN